MDKLIIGISGASGTIYGIRLLQILSLIRNLETHLIITSAGCQTLALETSYTFNELKKLASVVHNIQNIAANISSGSFKTLGMVIIPCSMKTLSGIANSYSDNILTRAADVVLKERRKLVLCIRETPLHIGHIRIMHQAAKMGAIIMPPIPAFYHKPKTIEDILDQTINRVIDQFDINLPKDFFPRWNGVNVHI